MEPLVGSAVVSRVTADFHLDGKHQAEASNF